MKKETKFLTWKVILFMLGIRDMTAQEHEEQYEAIKQRTQKHLCPICDIPMIRCSVDWYRCDTVCTGKFQLSIDLREMKYKKAMWIENKLWIEEISDEEIQQYKRLRAFI
jgi:hypothetical protein